MKHYYFILFLSVITVFNAHSQSTGINTQSPHPKAALDVRAVGLQGFVPPRLPGDSTAQFGLTGVGGVGMFFYDTSAQLYRYYSGSGIWKTFGNASVLPAGTNGQTLRHNGTNWITNSLIYNTGTKVGIGLSAPSEKLHVFGKIRLDSAFMPGNNAGTAGQVLTSAGPGLAPTWSSAGISGTGTDKYVARWSGTSSIATGSLIDDGTHIYPEFSVTSDLGTGSNSWKDAYVGGYLYIAGAKWTSLLKNNTLIGTKGDESFTSGVYNLGVGQGAGNIISSGSRNTLVGHRSGESVKSSDDNTMIGSLAGGLNSSPGSENTFIGSQSGHMVNNSGSRNTFLGFSTGDGNTTGSNNTLLGYRANVTDGTISNATAIGNNASVAISNAVVLGDNKVFVGIGTGSPAHRLHVKGSLLPAVMVQNEEIISPANSDFSAVYFGDASINTPQASIVAHRDKNSGGVTDLPTALIFNTTKPTAASPTEKMRISSEGNVGIGTTAPTASLHINGNFRLEGSGYGAGRVLTSDASGNATWQAPAAVPSDNVTGTGVTNRVAFWNGANTLTSNADLYWDNTNSRLGIGIATPGYKIHVSENSTNPGLFVRQDGTGPAIQGNNYSSGIGVQGGSSGSGYAVYANMTGTGTALYATTSGTGYAALLMGGNVGIGTATPSERLEVNGNIEIPAANDYKYATAKTDYFSAAPSSFTSNYEPGYSMGRIVSNSVTNYTYFITGTATSQGYATAPVNLPNEAVVTSLTAYLYRNDGAVEYNPTVVLARKTLSSDVNAEIAECIATANSASVQTIVDNTILNGTVNNSLYGYSLIFSADQNSSNQRLYGVRITYTVTKAD